MRWAKIAGERADSIIQKHQKLLGIVLNASSNGYEFDDDDAILVEGIENENEISGRILATFQQLFYEDYSVIMFPEALGTEQLVLDIQNIMRFLPEIMLLKSS